ncbi:MAG: hypothetical protein ABSC88_12880 [Terracidiphilus sp.]
MDWTAYDATIAGWRWEYRTGVDPYEVFSFWRRSKAPDNAVAVRLCSRSSQQYVFTTMSLRELPPRLAKLCGEPSREAAIPEWLKRESFPMLLARSPGKPAEESVDPYKMRDEFFDLKDDLDRLLVFVRKWGLWDTRELSICPEETLEPISRNGIPCILPHLIWRKQTEYRKVLCAAPERWLSQPEKRIHIVQKAQKPYFFANQRPFADPEICQNAIVATITLDHLTGSRFRICAKPGCNRLFKPVRRQKHCSRACAHAMAVQAYRDRAKKKVAKGKKRGR